MAPRLVGAKPLSEQHFNETLIEIYTFSFKKIHFKMAPGKGKSFGLGLNEVTGDKIS